MTDEQARKDANIDACADAQEKEARLEEFAMLVDGGAIFGRQSLGASTESAISGNRMSAQEEAIWTDFENGADFAVEDVGQTEDGEKARLEDAIKAFGIWDSERSAFELGFRFGKDISQEEDSLIGLNATANEDAFLTDILTNTLGLSHQFFFLSVSLYLGDLNLI